MKSFLGRCSFRDGHFRCNVTSEKKICDKNYRPIKQNLRQCAYEKVERALFAVKAVLLLHGFCGILSEEGIVVLAKFPLLILALLLPACELTPDMESSEIEFDKTDFGESSCSLLFFSAIKLSGEVSVLPYSTAARLIDGFRASIWYLEEEFR